MDSGEESEGLLQSLGGLRAGRNCCFIRVEAIREGDTARKERLSVVSSIDPLEREKPGLRMDLLGSQDILVGERRLHCFEHDLTRMGTSVHMRGGLILSSSPFRD